MFQFNVTPQPQFTFIDPPFVVIGQQPGQGVPGQCGFQIINPTGGPTIIVMMSRDNAEDFIQRFRESLDTAKGIKK